MTHYLKGSPVGTDGYTIARSTTVANGGSLARRYRRNKSAARDLARKRVHGVPVGREVAAVLGRDTRWMRPPGSGSVDYQRGAWRRKRAAAIVDAVTDALANGVAGG